MVWCAVLDAAGGLCQVGTEAQNRFGTVSTQSAALEPGMELELLLLLRAEKLLFADTRESRLELIILADLSPHNSSRVESVRSRSWTVDNNVGRSEEQEEVCQGEGEEGGARRERGQRHQRVCR